MLEDMELGLPDFDHDLLLSLAPSFGRLQKFEVRVDQIRCDSLVYLFESCPNVKEACFVIMGGLGEERALDFIAKIVQLAWRRKELRTLEVTFEGMGAGRGEFWDKVERV